MEKPDEKKYAHAMAFWRQLGLTSADELLRNGIPHNEFYKSQFIELDICLNRHHPMIYTRTIGEFGRCQRLDLSLLNLEFNMQKIKKLAGFIDGLKTRKSDTPMFIGYGTFNPRGTPTLEYFNCGERENVFVNDYVANRKK